MSSADRPIPRRSLHRGVFVVPADFEGGDRQKYAGIYNIAWGIFSIVDPQWLFRVGGMAPLEPPSDLRELGDGGRSVRHRVPRDRARPGAGLAPRGGRSDGKVLGPIGSVYLIATGTWPLKTLIIAVTNDFIWWPAFTLYLVDAWPALRRDVSGHRRHSR